MDLSHIPTEHHDGYLAWLSRMELNHRLAKDIRWNGRRIVPARNGHYLEYHAFAGGVSVGRAPTIPLALRVLADNWANSWK